jgi:FkbH-like protein
MGIVLVNPDRLDICSPMSVRYDLTSDLRSGFPYSLSHAFWLSNEIAKLLFPPPLKKGIITDLDNTLWNGILGEDGVRGISWELADGNHVFALYQEMLASLQDLGVLIGVASKNEQGMVTQALKREDLVIDSDRIFPVEAHWGEKSGSVGRILKSWNIAADSVVFIDNSPLELAEVGRAFPEMECLLFPYKDGAAFLDFIKILRDRFGKEDVSLEDSLRVKTLRDQPRPEMVSVGDSDKFLESLQGRIRIVINQPDKRTLELINKTNQFNLNGHRIDYSSWQNRLKDPGNFVWSIYYQDKFGPLGQISVVSGNGFPDCGALVDVWIISCRAFSRRLEHHIMGKLLEDSPDGVVHFKYQPTERNGVLRDFLLSMSGKSGEDGNIFHSIEKSVFFAHCPPLCHEVIIQ